MMGSKRGYKEITLARWVSNMLSNGNMAEDLAYFKDGVSFPLFVSKTLNIPLRTTPSPSKKDKERNVKGALETLNAIDSRFSKLKISPRHILDVKEEAYEITTMLFWHWLKKHLLEKEVKQMSSENRMFKEWVNEMLPSTYQLYNFQDNLLSGKCIAGLVNALRPDLVPDWNEWEDIGDEKKLKEAFGYAAQIGIRELVTYRDMYRLHDVDSNIIFLSQFLVVPRKRAQAAIEIQSETTLDEKIQHMIQHKLRHSMPPKDDTKHEVYSRNMQRSQSLNKYQGEPNYLFSPQERPYLSLYEYSHPRSELQLQAKFGESVEHSDNDIVPKLERAKEQHTNSYQHSPPSDNIRDVMDKVSISSDVQETILSNIIKGQIRNIKQLQEGHNSTTCTWDVRLAIPHEGFSFRTAKTLKPNPSKKDLKTFFEEANQMLILKHDNLVKCEGIVHTNSMTYIIMPRMIGTLRTYLTEQECQGKEISLDWFSTWSKDIASGMSYFVAFPLTHRSLTCGNLMLDNVKDAIGQPPIVKISGFTFSRDIVQGDYETMESSRVEMLPFPWMPPEILNMMVNKMDIYSFGQTTDRWSYGCTLWEMYSYGHVPYENLKLTTPASILNFLDKGRVLERPIHMPEHIYNAIVKPCWRRDPQSRPKFPQIECGLGLGGSLELLDSELRGKRPVAIKCPGAPLRSPIEKENKPRTKPSHMSGLRYESLASYANVDPDITTPKVPMESAL